MRLAYDGEGRHGKLILTHGIDVKSSNSASEDGKNRMEWSDIYGRIG